MKVTIDVEWHQHSQSEGTDVRSDTRWFVPGSSLGPRTLHSTPQSWVFLISLTLSTESVSLEVLSQWSLIWIKLLKLLQRWGIKDDGRWWHSLFSLALLWVGLGITVKFGVFWHSSPKYERPPGKTGRLSLLIIFPIAWSKTSLNIKFTYPRNGPLEFSSNNREFACVKLARLMKFDLPLNI